MTLEGFDAWDKENKSKYPVRFFLQETLYGILDDLIHRTIINPCVNARWALTYRFCKDHQYNTIRPRTLKPGYYDEETRVLHAVMECLVRYVEVNISDITDKNPPDELKELYATLLDTYTWWTEKYPHRDEVAVDGTVLPTYPKFPHEWGELPMLRSEYDNHPIMVQWKLVASTHTDNSQSWFNEEQEMLIKVIQIRKDLWD